MLAYWERDCEWMGDGLQLAICPSFTGPTSLAAIDVSGRSNHATLTNMDRNTAWQANGGKGAISTLAGGTVRVPNAPAINPTEAMSITVWVNYTEPQGARAVIAKAGDVGQYGIFTDIGNNRKISFVLWENPKTTHRAISTSLYNDGQWHLVCGVYNRANVIINIDGGADVVVGGAYSGNIPVTSQGLWMGAFTNGGGAFAGLFDDGRVYNRALTAPEIRQLYERDRAGGMLRQPPSRRSYYAQLAAAFSILAESGSYALTGQAIPLLYGRVLPADTGSVLLSGQTTPLLTSRLLNADQGSYAYSGTDAATLLGRLLDAGAAAYTLDGTAAGFIASRRISAETVAYLASGLDAGFLRGRVLEAGTGQYVLVASPVNLQTGTPGTGGAAPYYYLFLLGGSR